MKANHNDCKVATWFFVTTLVPPRKLRNTPKDAQEEFQEESKFRYKETDDYNFMVSM